MAAFGEKQTLYEGSSRLLKNILKISSHSVIVHFQVLGMPIISHFKDKESIKRKNVSSTSTTI